MEELEEEIDPLDLVQDLRLGQQQIVEIARALSINSRILIMDEPTSALSASEVEVLFRVIRDLTSRGVSIVYISHHLEEALQITDFAVVLRDGVITATAEAKDIDLEWIVRNMVGENYDLGSPPTGYDFGAPVLSIENVSVADASGTKRLAVDHLSLEVKAGRDRLHLRPDGGRPDRTARSRRRAGAARRRPGRCSTARTSPPSRSPIASPRAFRSCPRTASATASSRR